MPILSLIILLGFGSSTALAYSFDECPDCITLCEYYDFMGLSGCGKQCPPELTCDRGSFDSFGVSDEVVIYSWNGDDVPFHGSSQAGRVASVSSARIAFRARSSSDFFDSDVRLYSKNCVSGGYSLIDNTEFQADDWDTFTYDVTGYFTECNEEFEFMLEHVIPSFVSSNILWIDLEVEYTLSASSLEAVMSTSLPASNSIGKEKSFFVYADVYCDPGECGNTDAILQFREYGSTGFTNVGSLTSGQPLVTSGANPYGCGDVVAGSPCSHAWEVLGAQKGQYYIRVLADSSVTGVADAYSSEEEFFVKVGNVFIDQAYFSQNPLDEPYMETTLHATVRCSGYYCGNVDIYAKNMTGKIPSEDEYFMLSGDNPVRKYIQPGASVDVSWDITPKTSGVHDGIFVIADPADPDLLYSPEEYPSTSLVVYEPSPDNGYLMIEGAEMYPSEIETGQASHISGTVSCWGGPCGEVFSVIYVGGEEASPTGQVSVEEENTISCGYMEDGDSCPVSWYATGNQEGEYAIWFSADSSEQSVSGTDSEHFALLVTEPPGDVILSAYANPYFIDVSETSVLTSNAFCSGSWCGDITLTLMHESGEAVGQSGGLNTQSLNPVSCGSSCQSTWSLYGEEPGIYDIRVEAYTSEGKKNYTDYMSMHVIDPAVPPEPLIDSSSISDKAGDSGSDIGISATASCFYADCGECQAYLQRWSGSYWENLSESSAVMTGSNLNQFVLEKDDSIELEWLVSSEEEGSHELRMVLESGNAGSLNEYFALGIASNESGERVISVEVSSPEPGSVFWRGDSVPVEVSVTENFFPKKGLHPSAVFSGGFSETVFLTESGEGVYSGSAAIPDNSGSNVLVSIEAYGKEESIQIEVRSGLDVSANIEKASFMASESVVLTGTVMKDGYPSASKLSLGFECSGWKSSVHNIAAGPEGEFSYSYNLPKDIPTGSCSVNVSASDGNGNSGSDSALFEVIRSEKDVFDIEFLSPPAEASFSTGDDFTLSLDVLMDGIHVTGTSVKCTDVSGNFNIRLNETGESYAAVLAAQRPGSSNKWNLRCLAEANDGLYGSGFTNIVVNPVIVLDVIEPERREFEKGENVNFKVQAFSDGVPMTDGSIYVDIGGDVVDLEHTRNGIFEYQHKFEREGQQTFEFFAYDGMGNLDSREVMLTAYDPVRINWLAIALSGSGIVLLGMLWFTYKTRKGKTVVKTVTKTVTRTVVKKPDRRTMLEHKLKDLKKERAAIEKAKDDAEMEYYQRNLTEAEFKKMAERYEEELIKLNAEIEEFEEELGSL